MKLLALILSFFVLFLMLNPCSDSQNHEHDFEKELPTNHSHKSDKDDLCSVFCVCSCCGVLTRVEQLFVYEFKTSVQIPTSLKLNSFYKSNYRFDFYSSIWQPPRFDN